MGSLTLPAIVTDIDGVLVRQKSAIPRSADAVRFLKTPLQDIDAEKFAGVNSSLPFVCLTNSGSLTEKQKSESLNHILGLTESHQLKEEQVVMCYTPLRPILEDYKEKTVMLAGVSDLAALAESFGLKKYITDEEYCIIYPRLVCYRPKSSPEVVQELKKKIAERLEIANIEDLEEPVQVHAIILVNDPIKWEERIQIICDLLTGPDGKIAQKMPKVGPEEHIPIYITNDDITYAGKFRLPRIGFGCFNESLKQVYKAIYKKEPKLSMYGKPEKSTFDFTENLIKSQTNAQISNFYMIGDNPKSDIRGGNNAGWTTILVKTGVFQQTEVALNDSEDPAKYVVENFDEAIQLICELEGIKTDYFAKLNNN